jgi:hypothetical protein
MRLIAPSDYRRMPWKNGGGTTFEVAVHPHGADWEASRGASASRRSQAAAVLVVSGDRPQLVVLAGGGMVLTGMRGCAVIAAVRLRRLRRRGAGREPLARRADARPQRDDARGAARADVRVVRSERRRVDAARRTCATRHRSVRMLVDDTTIDVAEAHTLVADARASPSMPRHAVRDRRTLTQ